RPGGSKATPLDPRRPELPCFLPSACSVLRPYGPARRRAGSDRAAARDDPRRGAKRSAVPQARTPRAVPVGPALGDRRGDMSQPRRLAAILAADVAGYSRLMGADEEGTHDRLKAHLVELVNPKIAEHRGRIVKNTGDGLLAEFPSVIEAVRCGVEVQQAMAD